MSDNSGENIPENGTPPRLRRDADKGREPKLLPGQMGQRWISLNALVERIEAAFLDEHGDQSPELLEADTPAKRLKMVLATVDYVLTVESVQVSMPEKADIINRVYSNLFGYGPLDALFLDETVTTISLDGADKAAVRHAHGDLTSLGPIFQNEEHLRRVLKRLLIDAGAEFREDQPYIETGFTIGERPVALNLVAPPAAFQLTADIRVHPPALPTPDELITSGFMTAQSAELLKAIAQSPHGLLVVGEPESGKTTLMNIIAHWLPSADNVISVERAGEMRLPPTVTQRVVKWPVAEQPGISFGEQIGNALAQSPSCILLDEVRSDEPGTIAPLLEMENAPRQIWSFRGGIFIKRLGSALGMLARRADVGGGEDRVRALYERLPFVVTVNRNDSALRLWSIGEWQFKHSPDYPTYTSLMQIEAGELIRTGERPVKSLDLPESFWEAGG